jgi:chromate reductase, NAD(P)H dehydrogenase (quinone)
MTAQQPTILCISGSLREGSSNSKILAYIAQQFNSVANFEVYGGIGLLPFFSPERDIEPAHPEVANFRNRLQQADGVLVCTPEYAFGVPGVLKNALDWTVSSAEFSRKPTALITASSVGEKGHQALLHTFDAIDANIAQDSKLLISFIRTKFDADGKLKEGETTEAIKAVALSLLENITKV